jgi:DNA-binding PadR family transcriptional regulator
MADKNEPLTESYYYILLCLYNKPNHGYGIMQDTEKLSSGAVKIGSGTMYGATSNMMKKGWIRETLSDNPDDRRKRLYELTQEGRRVLEEEITRLKRLIDGSEIVLKGGLL